MLVSTTKCCWTTDVSDWAQSTLYSTWLPIYLYCWYACICFVSIDCWPNLIKPIHCLKHLFSAKVKVCRRSEDRGSDKRPLIADQRDVGDQTLIPSLLSSDPIVTPPLSSPPSPSCSPSEKSFAVYLPHLKEPWVLLAKQIGAREVKMLSQHLHIKE